MAVIEFNVSISPQDAYNILRREISAELVYDELKKTDNGMEIGILVFEKYYFRAENRASLTVIADNFDAITSLRVIAAGSSKGMLFNFDWGAADNFAESVRKILIQYII